MKDIHKKWLRRYLAVVILFCLLLQSMSGTITASDNSSKNNTEGMHFIVRHWHADGSSEDIEGYLHEDGSLKVNGKVADISSGDDKNTACVKLSVKPKDNETFTGFATAAGHEAVKRNRDDNEPNKSSLEISYKPDIHLAKVHIFYKDTLQEKQGASLGAKETEIGDKGKVYNTSVMGLHTDKTIAVAEGSDDGRTFDLTLESWYVGNNQANVGMVLDASGSMAFTSNDLEPVKITEEQINKYGKLKYIPQRDVNDILNPLYTDNSKLGYSDYAYYVYDPSEGTKEYVPIGYWNGETAKDIRVPLPAREKLISYYSFNQSGNQINQVDKINKAKTVNRKNPVSGNIVVSNNNPSISDKNALVGKGLDLAKPFKDEIRAVVLDTGVPATDSFTISFGVNGENEKPVMWLGNSDQTAAQAWYAIYADTEEKRTEVVSGKGISTIEYYGNNALGSTAKENLSKSGWNVCTYVFKERNDGLHTDVTFYINGEKKGTGTVDSGVLNGAANPVIVIGGSAWEADYGGNNWESQDNDKKYLVDELYIYNDALTEKEVNELYSAMWNPSEESAFAATSPSDKDKTMAELKNARTDGSGEGWYCVSSGSSWSQITNKQLLTSKSYRGIPKDEVIFNRIDEVPKGTKQPEAGNTPGYIYTGNPDFHGNDGDTPAIKIEADWNGSIIFFIDGEGYLRCFFNGGKSQNRKTQDNNEAGGILNIDSSSWYYDNNKNASYCSYVYQKSDEQRIKTEALQYALGSFVTQLNEVSPDSQVSAVRFGTQDLIVEGDADATDENLKTLVLLDWTKNTMESTGILGLRRGKRTADGSDESGNGVNQYNYVLTGGTATWTGLQSYVSNLKERDGGENGVASKHLIIFTDGKDTTGSDKENGKDKAVKLAQALRDEGYTIYCVMLQSAGNGIEDSREFLEKLASKPEYVFHADNVEELTNIFTTKILNNLVGNLSDYTVQDYIDPRFNLVAADGTVIKLNKGGNIVIGENNFFVSDTEGCKVTLTADTDSAGTGARAAMLYYDSIKEMYYLQWKEQTIPSCGLDAKRLDVWETKITVRAKDDFLGGNAILTNGNRENMNKVFSHKCPEGNEEFPSKNFPQTAANVELLRLAAGNELNTVYKGEMISPEDLMDILGEKTDNNTYYEYLERYLNHVSGQEEYDEIKSALAGGRPVEIPYMYLPDIAGKNQTGAEHKNDRIGTLIYMWQECEDNGLGSLIPKTENPVYEAFVTEDTNSRYYRFTITYEPWPEDARKAEMTENNKLISNMEYSKPHYWAGDKQKEISAFGVHQTDIVSGELVAEAKVLLSDLLYMAQKNKGTLDMEETFTVIRTYNGEESTMKLKLPFRYTVDKLLSLLPEADGDGYISIYSEPFTELPIGEYRIWADNVTPLEFGGISRRDILDGNGHFSEKYKAEGKESMYRADSVYGDNNSFLTFYLGIQSPEVAGDDGSHINLNARLGHVAVTYTSEKNMPAETTAQVVIDGVKHLSGRELKKGEFVFELLDNTGNSIQQTTNEADGSFRFDKLSFDKEGTYIYILREQENEVRGVTYDRKYYLVQIYVRKQDGRLTAELNYSRGEKERVEKAEFYNKYEDNESLDNRNPLGVATGDLSNSSFLKAIMLMSFFTVVIMVFYRKKKNRE